MKRPTLLATMLLLLLVDVSLRVFGFARVMRLAKRLTPTHGSANDSALMRATIEQIVRATAFYPGRSQCLEQSVAGFILLRRRGFDVRLRLGVQPYPFAAHAWVEYDGKAITESQEVVSRFAVLPEVAL